MVPIIIGVVVLAVIGGVVFFVMSRRRSVVAGRLEQFTQAGQAVAPAAKAQPAEGAKSSPLAARLDQLLTGRSFADNIGKELARADLKLTVAEYLAMHVILAFGVFAVVFFMKGLVWGILGAIVGLFVPRFYVGNQQKGRLVKFDNQLGDMLNLCVNGLRAGYSVMQALESVSKELPSPMSTEFKRVVQEMQLGLPMEQSLGNLTRRIPSKDLDFVVTAINVQREVGGNLAEILDTITFTIRERVRIKGEIETLTAQGMMTGYVISLLPIGLGIFLSLINPTYMGQMIEKGRFLFCGIGMIIAIILMIAIGFAIIMKIVNIEV
jgi:tight adherence protein B